MVIQYENKEISKLIFHCTHFLLQSDNVVVLPHFAKLWQGNNNIRIGFILFNTHFSALIVSALFSDQPS